MYCNKCGTENLEYMKFCEKCGSELREYGYELTEYNIEDNEVLLSINPIFNKKYQFWSVALSPLLIILLITMPVIFEAIIMFFSEIMHTSEEAKEIGFVLILLVVGIPLFYIILTWILVSRREKDICCTRYDFYKTKFVCFNSNLNKSKYEIKYKCILKTSVYQNLVEQKFNFGSIILHTINDNGRHLKVTLMNFENVNEHYKEIKKIINK